MTKAFTKNQAANLLQNWDNKGTVRIVPVVVMACGEKKMTLQHAETGEMLGNNFLPKREQYFFSLVIDASEDAEAVAFAQAEIILADRREQYARCLASGQRESYNNAIRKDLAELHEPRVIRSK